jgi:hypothetical protein
MYTTTVTYSIPSILKTGLVLMILAALTAASSASAQEAGSEVDISVNGMEAAVTFMLGTPCSPYVLDWGDGEKIEQEVSQDTMCIQVTQEITQRHTYEEEGVYEISLTYSGQNVIEEITVSTDVASFDLEYVVSVTSLWVDPNEMMADEEYTIYTITLEDGSVIKVNAGGFTTKEWRRQQFVEAGYTGDVDALIALAEPETDQDANPIPAPDGEETSILIKMQERIIELLNQLISLLNLR